MPEVSNYDDQLVRHSRRCILEFAGVGPPFGGHAPCGEVRVSASCQMRLINAPNEGSSLFENTLRNVSGYVNYGRDSLEFESARTFPYAKSEKEKEKERKEGGDSLFRQKKFMPKLTSRISSGFKPPRAARGYLGESHCVRKWRKKSIIYP